MAGWTVDYPEDVTYDGKEHKWEPTIVDPSGEIITEDNKYVTPIVTYSTNDFKNVTGTIEAKVQLVPKSGNITFDDPDNPDEPYPDYFTRIYKITPLQVEIRVNNTTKVMGEEDPQFTYDIIGLVEGDSIGTVTLQRDLGEAVGGPYYISASVSNLNSNYTYSVTPGTLYIKAAPVEPPTDPEVPSQP